MPRHTIEIETDEQAKNERPAELSDRDLDQVAGAARRQSQAKVQIISYQEFLP